MITVTYVKNKRLTLTITGHAGADEKGQDLVCGAASMLAYTLAQNIRDAERLGIVSRVEIKLDEGDSVISCTPKREYREAVAVIYNVIRRGYDLLAANYGDFIKIVYSGGNRNINKESPT